MSAGREVRVEKLAPTGEGVVRGPEGVGFVEGALAGELVATTVYEVRKRFWRGRRLHSIGSRSSSSGGERSCRPWLPWL